MYQVVSADGNHVRSTPVPTSRGQMMHDFGITRNFAVFVEQALVFDPVPMFVSGTLPITLDKEAQCRCCSQRLFPSFTVLLPCGADLAEVHIAANAI
jgi:carotenoid cleavage dioxygenase-like enzyme